MTVATRMLDVILENRELKVEIGRLRRDKERLENHVIVLQSQLRSVRRPPASRRWPWRTT